jgi:hypothetical protein
MDFIQRNKRINETNERNKYIGMQPDFSERVTLYSRNDFLDNKYTPDVRDVSQTGRKLGLTGLGNSESATFFFSNKNLENIAKRTGYENNCSFQEMLQKFFKDNLILNNVWSIEEGKRLSKLAINKFDGTNKKLRNISPLHPRFIGNKEFPDRPTCTTIEKYNEFSTGLFTPDEFRKKINGPDQLSYF